MKPNTEAKLAAAAAKITTKDLQGSGPKNSFVQFRVSEAEKSSLQETAERLGLQVSEYLLKLHELASANLKHR
jgi:acetyl-CoA carboxylase alpha subunit